MIAILTVIGAIAFLSATGAIALATERLTRGFDQVPTHLGISGKPDAFGSRWVVIGLIPAIHVLTYAVLVAVPLLGLPTHGDPAAGLAVGIVMTGVTFAGAQGLIFVLTRRWRRGQ